jgi:hypothetical protein
MHFNWKDLPVFLQEKIAHAATIMLPMSPSMSLVSVLFSLSEMKYQWKNRDTLDQAITEGIIANYRPTKSNSAKFHSQEITNCIHYLGQLSNVNENDKVLLEKEVFDALWNGIKNSDTPLSPPQVVSILLG